jgi:hypothetical protein
VHLDRLDAIRDRIGDEHDVAPRLGEWAGFVREREAAEAGAAHAEIGRGAGKFGRIAFPLAIGAARVVAYSWKGITG